MFKTLTRDEILAAQDLQREYVNVPEWGGRVVVKTLTGSERDAFEQAIVGTKTAGGSVTLDNVRARLAAATVTGEDGTPLFTEADVAALSAKNASALDRIFDVSQRLNRLRKQDVEELVGNSSAAPSGASTSSSPSPSEDPSASSSKKSTRKS